MPRITPFLWFDTQAEEAAKFYTSVFKNSKIVSTSHYEKAGAKASGIPEGTVMTVNFELDGQPFTALNGGPDFRFTEAISFVVHCDGQDEIDYYWTKLSEGGEEGQCGWLKDQYGMSWQVIPVNLGELLDGSDPNKLKRAMEALLQMRKLDIAALERAREG